MLWVQFFGDEGFHPATPCRKGSQFFLFHFQPHLFLRLLALSLAEKLQDDFAPLPSPMLVLNHALGLVLSGQIIVDVVAGSFLVGVVQYTRQKRRNEDGEV